MTQHPNRRASDVAPLFDVTRPPDPDRRAPAPEPATPPHTSREWLAFVRALEQVLAVLENGQFLVLEHTRSSAFVQVAVQGAAGLQVEAASDRFLKPGDQLGERGRSLLRRLGWQRPTFVPDRARGTEVRPGESPNYFKMLPATAPVADAANLAVATLRLVYGVAHPGDLVYKSFAADGREILLPTLQINRIRREPTAADVEVVARRARGPEELEAWVVETVQGATGLGDLAFDDDDELVLSYDNLPVLLRVDLHEPVVTVLATLLRGLEPTPGVLAALNELNNGQPYLTFSLIDGGVLASTSVDCNPFVPDAVLRAMTRVGRAAADAARDLQPLFGGEIPTDPEGGTERRTRGGTAPPTN